MNGLISKKQYLKASIVQVIAILIFVIAASFALRYEVVVMEPWIYLVGIGIPILAFNFIGLNFIFKENTN